MTAANPDGTLAADPVITPDDLTRWDQPASLAGLVDRASVDQLLALLGDPVAWQAASRAAVARVERYYTDTLMFDRYRRVYDRALAHAPGVA